MKTSLIMFTLNEIEAMRIIMPQIKKEWYNELIIADGGSTDGTIEYAKEHDYPLFIQSKKGYGSDPAFVEAIERITGDIFIAFSLDGNSLPEKIPELIEEIKKGYDMVICSRYLKGARSYDDDMFTAIGNRLYTGLVRLLYKTNITDSMVMFRAYRTNMVKELNIDPAHGSFGTQLLLKAIKKGKKVGQIPGNEPFRIGGFSKVNRFKHGFCELALIVKEFFLK